MVNPFAGRGCDVAGCGREGTAGQGFRTFSFVIGDKVREVHVCPICLPTWTASGRDLSILKPEGRDDDGKRRPQ